MTTTFLVIRHRQADQKTAEIFVSSDDRNPTPLDALNFAMKHPNFKDPGPTFQDGDRIEMRWREGGEEKLQLFKVEREGDAISVSPFIV
jgi:hypothetical protein